MTTAYALLVGIEKYDIGLNFDVRGPCANAIALAKWLLSRNTPAENIFMFLEPLESHRLDDEIIALQSVGVSIERSGALNTIEAFWRYRLPSLGGSHARFFFYWCGHGYTAADGSRLFLCSDYQDNDVLRDKVFDADGFIVLLRSPDFHFADQMLLADVCARPEEYAGQLAPKIPSPRTGSGARQVWIFATTEGASSNGHFTSVVLRILNTYPTWPAQSEFVSQVLSMLRESGETPFLGVYGFDGNSEISFLLGPTLSDAERMLEQGALRKAMDALVYLHQRLREVPDLRKWERCAYQIFKKVSSMPLESVDWQERPIWSLDASDEEWFLGIGTSDGAAYVKRLRIPISPVKEHWQSDYWAGLEGPLTISLIDQTVNLLPRQEQYPPADVRFPPGACLNQSLEVRRGVKGSAEFLLSTKAMKPSLWKEFKDELGAFERYGGSVSLTYEGLLTITSQDLTKSVTLPLLDERDRFFALEVVQGESGEDFRFWIACLSKSGRLYVVDQECRNSFQDLQCTEQARRLYAVPERHSFIVETERELFIIGLWEPRGHASFTLDLVPGHPDKLITSSAMLQMSNKGQDIALGYADGSVETCPAKYSASTQGRRAAFHLHHNPVIALRRVPGYGGFFSVSKESVAILRNPERGADHMVFSPHSEITSACLTRDGTHLVTGHSNGLMLWDVERPGRGDNRVQRWNKHDSNDRITLISDLLSTVPQARWLILNGEVSIHDDHMWIVVNASVFFVARSTFTPVTGGSNMTSDFSARFCWSHTGESILLLRTPSSKDDIHTYLIAPLTVVRFLDDDRVLSQDIRVGERRPTAYAAHPFSDSYCVGFDDGTVVEVSFSSKGPPRYKVTRLISTPLGVSVSSCAYSPDGTYLVVVLRSEPYIMIADLTTKHVLLLNHTAGGEGRIYTGPARFAPHGNVLFVCTNDGGVSSVKIQSGAIELLQYYHPPRHLSSSVEFLSLATSGKWFVGGIGNSVYRWNVDGGVREPSVYIVSDTFLRHLSAVPDADRFISIDGKGECICWDALSGERVGDITTDAYWHNDLSFSPDGSLVSVFVDSTLEEAVFPIFKTDQVLLEFLKGLLGKESRRYFVA